MGLRVHDVVARLNGYITTSFLQGRRLRVQEWRERRERKEQRDEKETSPASTAGLTRSDPVSQTDTDDDGDDAQDRESAIHQIQRPDHRDQCDSSRNVSQCGVRAFEQPLSAKAG